MEKSSRQVANHMPGSLWDFAYITSFNGQQEPHKINIVNSTYEENESQLEWPVQSCIFSKDESPDINVSLPDFPLYLE